MDKIMEKFNKLSLPAVILIASIVLGGFFYASQLSKQRSIERQQQIKIRQDMTDQLAKELKEQEAKDEVERQARLNKIFLDACLSGAYTNYTVNFKSECKTRSLKEDCSLPDKIAESLENAYKDDKADCFKKYPQK